MIGNCLSKLSFVWTFYLFTSTSISYSFLHMSYIYPRKLAWSLFCASYGALSAIARRDDESRSDRIERRMANAPEFCHSDDPHGRYRSLSTERRLVAYIALHWSINSGPLSDYSVFQFFYLECNSRWPVCNPRERWENAKGAAYRTKIRPTKESQQHHDRESTCGFAAWSEVINH